MCKIYNADLESSGLLHHLIEQGDKAKLHNFCAKSVETGEMWTLHANTEKEKEALAKFLNREIILIMHNGICYDKNALIHFGYDVRKIHFVDTLALSWYLDLNRAKHGLEDYGIEAGVPKPVIDDWESLTQDDYDNRVQEDVKIQEYTYKKLKARFEELYGEMSDYDFCTHRVVKYLNFKMEQLAEQQNTRLRIDVPRAKELIEEFSILIDEKTELLKSVMPKVPVYSKSTKPAKPFKKDGSLSANGIKWKELTEKAKVDFDFDGEIKTIKSYDEPNPQSPQQIKDWLFSLGWIPETFKYDKNEDGSERKIPQIYIPQSGGMLCPSIEKLADETEEVQALVGLGVVKHRKGSIQGFLDSLIFGEYIEAGAKGFTNTLRLKHRKPCVNLPSSRVAYGEDVRGCIIARECKRFVCSDLSSMENLWSFNYQMPYDPDYVYSQQSKDYDPHLALAKVGGLITQDELNFFKIESKGFPKEDYPLTDGLNKMLNMSDEEKNALIKAISKKRGIGKNCGYALQYNCGVPTLARTAKISEKEARVIFKAYKKLNWSIKAIADDQVRKTVSHGMYQWNPYSKMWYYLKKEHDSYSTLVQGSGSYLLDLWLKCIDNIKVRDGIKDELKLCMSMHDENLQEYQSLTDEYVKDIFQEALDMVNKTLKVDIPFGCDTQFGTKYSEIH